VHLLVTDRLACPRCGPAFGLLLLATAMVDRRIESGRFGCPNCRGAYPVNGGFADFRVAGIDELTQDAGEMPSAALEEGDAESGLRLAAMLGVQAGPGLLLLLGSPAAQAPRLAAMIPEIEVVAIHPRARGWSGVPGVSCGVAGGVLPFFTNTMRGVALGVKVEAGNPVEITEAVRVLVPGGRLVVQSEDTGADGAAADAGLAPWSTAMEEAGLVLLLATERVVVGQK